MANLFNVVVSLEFKTCYKGHVWAGPHWARPVSCPYCAEDLLDRARAERDSALRAAVSLRGQITKLRKARRG